MLDGGTLRSALTGYLPADITFNAGKDEHPVSRGRHHSTIGGDPGSTGNSAGACDPRCRIGSRLSARQPTPASIQIGASSTISPLDVDPTSSVVVAGGTLKDTQDQLFNILAATGAVTVNSGATIDFNSSFCSSH